MYYPMALAIAWAAGSLQHSSEKVIIVEHPLTTTETDETVAEDVSTPKESDCHVLNDSKHENEVKRNGIDVIYTQWKNICGNDIKEEIRMFYEASSNNKLHQKVT